MKIEEYTQQAYYLWNKTVGDAYTALGIPVDVPNQIIRIFIYAEQLGGQYSTTRDSITLPKAKLPQGRANLIRKADVDELFIQLQSRYMDAKTGKGYAFQLAVGLELLYPGSNLMRYILRQFGNDFTPAKYSEGLGLFSSDEGATQILNENRIGVSIDPDTTRKTGDLALKVYYLFFVYFLIMKVFKSTEEKVVRGEFKNSDTQQYLWKGCASFFEKASKLANTDIVVYLSMEKMEDAPTRHK